MKPLYRSYSNRYSVCWEVFTGDGWQKRKAQREAELQARRELEARTVDWLQPGEMQPERDHNLQGENSDAGEYNGRKLRHAVNGGWFSFEMKVDPTQTNQLICTWWGSENGQRTFDILVDDRKIATQRLLNNKPGQFWEATYTIPDELCSREAEGHRQICGATRQLRGRPFWLSYGSRPIGTEKAVGWVREPWASCSKLIRIPRDYHFCRHFPAAPFQLQAQVKPLLLVPR